jgi:catechol 2,3-dioxygenase-like lactoylglutathione lyase family enzyme
VFSTPQVNIHSRDVLRAVEFYRRAGFRETFRTPPKGRQSTSSSSKTGRGTEIALWTDDVEAAFADLVDAGARALSVPHDWLGGTIRVAWVADPDDNPVELVERRS